MPVRVFEPATKQHSAEGPNEPGIAAKLAKAVGDAGIDMRGFSAAVLGTRFVLHVGVDTAEETESVISLLSGL